MALTNGSGAALGLARACHPLPTFAVTAFAAAYAVRVGASAGTAGWVAVTALAGQLTVGWVNDAVDVVRDRTAQRTEKPLVAGQVTLEQVWTATLVAGVLVLVLSLRLGWRVGLLHLAAVGSAQAYNLRLKGTLASPVPYVVAFGLLPVIVTGAVWNLGDDATGAWPPVLHVLAAALLGAAAHAGNTVGDDAADRLTGVRGLPQRLGPQSSLLAMAGLIGLASVLLISSALLRSSQIGDMTPIRLVGIFLLVAGAAAAALVAVRRPGVSSAQHPASVEHPAPVKDSASSRESGSSKESGWDAGRGPDSHPGGCTAWRLTLGAVALVVLGFLLSA